MDFDINLILVPITLIFLLVWLIDVLFLKKHKAVAKAQKQQKSHQKALTHSKKALAGELVAHNLGGVDAFVVSSQTPEKVKTAYERYQNDKHALAQSYQVSVKEPAPVRWAYEFLPILLFLVVVRSFIAEPFNIPSSSMVPSLYTGDFILVNKAAYGLRLPITHTKLLDTGTPKNGDVAVFRYPNNEKLYYIKRVIGTPGDTVRFDGGVLSINGTPVATQKTSYAMPEKLAAHLYPSTIGGRRFADDERAALGLQEETYAHYYEEHQGDHRYLVRYLADTNSSQFGTFLQNASPLLSESDGQAWQITVPAGKYFVMGDNRDRSEDSRFWGFVDERYLAGKATYIWMHKKPGLALPSFGRVGKID